MSDPKVVLEIPFYDAYGDKTHLLRIQDDGQLQLWDWTDNAPEYGVFRRRAASKDGLEKIRNFLQETT